MNNTITLVGRVVQDPVKKSIPAKDTVLAEFSIAVKDYSKKGQDNDAIFFDVKAFNGQVDRIMEYIKKGREIVVNGLVSANRKLQLQRWDAGHKVHCCDPQWLSSLWQQTRQC